VNLRTHLERIITKAGHKPWPRLLQNLRASCETDWVERYPTHVVAPWHGHSPKVAAQQASARDSVPSHETTEPAATTRVTAGSAEGTPVSSAGPRQDAAHKKARRGHGWPGGREMAGTGFEPATSRL
jgi:hypothetical protein